MRIFYINNFGGGYADHLDIEAGTTVAQLFNAQMNGAKPDDFLIRVNRQPAPRDAHGETRRAGVNGSAA